MENYVLFPFKLNAGVNIINEAANANLNRSVIFKRTFWCLQIYQKKINEMFARNFNQKNRRLVILLESGINILLRLLIFGIFSRGYNLIVNINFTT